MVRDGGWQVTVDFKSVNDQSVGREKRKKIISKRKGWVTGRNKDKKESASAIAFLGLAVDSQTRKRCKGTREPEQGSTWSLLQSSTEAVYGYAMQLRDGMNRCSVHRCIALDVYAER